MNKYINYKNIDALFLALDGTLINSEFAFCNSFINAFKIFDIVVTSEEYKTYELEQNNMLIDIKKKEFSKELNGITKEDILALVYKDYTNRFKEVIIDNEASYSFKLLKELKQIGIKMALVTTCRALYLDILFETYNVRDIFDFIVCRDDVLPSELKPSPTAYYMALNNLNVPIDNCLAIEDSKRGIDAAVGAGIRTIKVNNYTTIKFNDSRAFEEKSANEVFKKILMFKK